MSRLEIGNRVRVNQNTTLRHFVGCAGTVVRSSGEAAYRVRLSCGSQITFCRASLTRVYDETPKVAPQPAGPCGHALPTDSAKRKEYPLFSGLLAYYPAALSQVAHHSFLGNEKHNPGLPLQHARGVSGDHEDCIIRHLIDAKEHPAGSTQRIEELRACAWRSLALLQEECELSFAPPAPAATFGRDKQ